MQVAQLNASAGIAPGGARALEAAALAPEAAVVAAPAQPAATTPPRRGLSNWDQSLQGDIASAQQALDFLDQSTSQLQALKSELAARLAARQGHASQVEARVRQFGATWRARRDVSGGSLDGQLRYSGTQPARQRFSIRGLTVSNLQAGGKEVLSFSVDGANRVSGSVTIEPGLSQEQIVQRFEQALAPANIRVASDDAGALVFSTPETSWPTVRDTLSVRGGGIRYPDGKMNRVQTDEAAPAIAPETWDTGDIDALRQTLQQVVQALAHLQQARGAVGAALAQASGRVATAQPAALGVGMDSLARNFIATAGAPGYQGLLAVNSALVGINRERVQSLLGLHT